MFRIISYIKIYGKQFLILFALLLFMLPGNLQAQQDPLYTQYMFNTMALNPGYAGTRDMLSLMVTTRHQWVGFDGAPSTQTFTANTPIADKNIGLGVSVIYDRVVPTKQTGTYIDYSFQINISKNSKLSFGIKGGGNFYQLDMAELNRLTPYDDPAYALPNYKDFLPNFGVGIYYYSHRFYMGISVPKLLENKLSDNELETYQTGKEIRHYYFMTGGVINISQNVKFKPSVLARLTQAAPFSLDLNANFLIMERLWVGGMYRVSESFGALVQFKITPQFSIGYSYDMNTNELQNYNSGTHEIMLNYDLNFNKDKVQNPRYF
jgi:type IX secretion system PorP/SprF family membrane protein